MYVVMGALFVACLLFDYLLLHPSCWLLLFLVWCIAVWCFVFGVLWLVCNAFCVLFVRCSLLSCVGSCLFLLFVN